MYKSEVHMIILKIFKSKNKSVYFNLARKYNTTVWYVYNLAHGKRVRVTGATYDILKELKALNIIQDVRI